MDVEVGRLTTAMPSENPIGIAGPASSISPASRWASFKDSHTKSDWRLVDRLRTVERTPDPSLCLSKGGAYGQTKTARCFCCSAFPLGAAGRLYRDACAC